MDNWLFSDPPVDFMEPCNYIAEVDQDGRELDFTTSGYADVPVVSEKVKEALSGLPEIDEPYKHVVLEPVRFTSETVRNKYFVMIIETQLDCVDETRSKFETIAEDDPIRPDLAGEYGVFLSLVVDPPKIGDHHIFRIKRASRAIIVSEEVKRRFEEAGVIGAEFESVNGDRDTVV